MDSGLSIKKLLLYYHTIKYLKWQQIRYRIYYGLRGKFRKLTGFKYQQKELNKFSSSLVLEKSLFAAKSVFCDGQKFSFLNLSKTFPSKINWNEAGHQKLWTYNLNYFEYLHQENFRKEIGVKLINEFIDDFEVLKDGLEPYPISLRVIHWIKFLTYHQIKDPKIDDSLYHQIEQLIDKLEYHILGNHLLENGFALLFGAYYFEDNNFYTKAKSILNNELEEQILSDGAHFELSPMYHQLMLYRILDCYNLVKNNLHFNQELLGSIKEKATLLLGWLQQITFRNGPIPLFNDCAFQVNLSTKELTEYANQLGINAEKKALKESGYRKISKGNYEIIVDIGKIGPTYIPGHAHSDTFNFELYINEKPFIVDTGTSTYNATGQRQLERSTASHNTVQIGSLEQAEIWSSFRVGRRNDPKVSIDNQQEILGSLTYATKNVRHSRHFQFFEKELTIEDSIDSRESGMAYLHFHPEVEVTLVGNSIQTNLGKVDFIDAESIEITSYQYAPEFNLLKAAKKAIVTFNHQLETKILIK